MTSTLKLLTIVGTRPQFIKMVLLSRELRRRKIREIVVHTGQHYDKEMSLSFFQEFLIPKPRYVLQCGKLSATQMVAKMLTEIERIVIREKPTHIMVYGDCNTTLAGALVGSQMKIPVVHIESGLRSKDRSMPEEINRVLTDHLSSHHFCATRLGSIQLAKEGIVGNTHIVGDLMIDLLRTLKLENAKFVTERKLEPNHYILLTIHRQSNTTKKRLEILFKAWQKIDIPMYFPAHPRTRKVIEEHKLVLPKCVRMVEPVPYKEMMILLKHALYVVTDSGGLQKEAHELKVPCVTVRKHTEWVETLRARWNRLSPGGTLPKKNQMIAIKKARRWKSLFLDNAAKRIVDVLEGKV